MSKAFILKSRPKGRPTPADFELIEIPIQPLEQGQVLLSALYISVDPYMRGRMSDQKSYIAPFVLGQPVSGGVVAKVVDTQADEFHVGDLVVGILRWQDMQVAWANEVQRIDPSLAPPSYYLGLFGLPGLTAFFGLTHIAKPKPAETLVISGAAGAVGMIVGQIGKIMGCNVIGIAGSKSKLHFLKTDLRFDESIDYHDLEKMDKELQKAAPLGVDIYFDNVGGVVSDVVLKHINHKSRIVICGQIALYNAPEKAIGPYPQMQLLKNSAMMKGFIVSDYQDYFHDGLVELMKWYHEGNLKGHETIVKGFNKLPETFISLFDGMNIGKLLVEV